MQPERQYKKNNPRLSFHLMKFAVQDFKKNSSSLTEDEYNQVLKNANEEMLLHQVILNSEEACCVVIPESILLKALSTVIAEYPSDDAFYEMLDANQLSYGDYVLALLNDLRVETVLGKIASSIQEVDSTEMLRYYKNHHTLFNRPEQRNASLIQISTTPSTGFDPALTTITEIHERLIQHPQDFALEAKNYSECDTGRDGGKLGTLSAGELCNELSATLFALKTDEISPVIESKNAYHILKCNMIYPAVSITFEEATEQIQPRLLKKKQLNACRIWLQKIVQGNKQS
jgi:peptidyl-prolyl cis-trans isomerase C